jgi:glycosyltransferase involved in cell wall biosynthesis
MKRHILLVIRYPVGGIRTFVRYVHGRLDPARYRLSVVLPQSLEHAAIQDDLSAFNPTFFTLPPNYRASHFLGTLLRAIRLARPDVIHSQGLTSGIYASLATRLTRTPHVVTLHDVFRPLYFTGTSGRAKRMLLSVLLRLPDTIHCVSQDAHQNLLQFFPRRRARKSVVAVIPHGIDVERFTQIAPRALHDELGLPRQAFLLGFFGRFMPEKGFRYLREAVAILNTAPDLNGRMFVLTFSNDGYYREERRAVAQAGLQEWFRFLPFTPNIAPTLVSLDAVVVPSLSETCPLLPMESMVAGRPVIGTNCIGLREVLQDTPSRICPPADPDALAAAIRAELQMPSMASAQAFQAEAVRRFDVRARLTKIEAMLEDAIVRCHTGSDPPRVTHTTWQSGRLS